MSRVLSPLEALSDDLVVHIFLALAHPLYPHPAFALSNSCRTVLAAVAHYRNHVTANGTSVYRVHLRWATAASSLVQRRFGTSALDGALRVARDVMQCDTRMPACDLDVLGYLLSSWLPTVTVLFLARVRIEGDGATLLFRRLAVGGGAVSLLHIYIDDSFVDAAGVQALGIALRRGSMPAIETIYLGGSLIGVGLVGSRGVATLAASLRRRPRFRALYLPRCHLRDADIIAMFAACDGGDYPALTSLDLERNSIGSDGMLVIATAIGRGVFPALRAEQLRLAHNRASDTSLAELSRSFGRRASRGLQL